MFKQETILFKSTHLAHGSNETAQKCAPPPSLVSKHLEIRDVVLSLRGNLTLDLQSFQPHKSVVAAIAVDESDYLFCLSHTVLHDKPPGGLRTEVDEDHVDDGQSADYDKDHTPGNVGIFQVVESGARPICDVVAQDVENPERADKKASEMRRRDLRLIQRSLHHILAGCKTGDEPATRKQKKVSAGL